MMPAPDMLTHEFLSTANAAHSIEVDGSPLKVFEFGSGAPVVLGTGYLWDVRMWRPQIEALSARYRVIVPELWGHNGSGALPTGTHSLRDLARQYLAMLDQLGVERFAMVGLSVGAMWGAELAIMAPKRVSSLVLIATSLAPEPEMYRERYLALVGAIEEHKGMPDPLREVIVPIFFSPTVAERHPDLPKSFDTALRAFSQERLLDSVVPLGRIIFLRRDAMQDAARLEIPMLVMTGSHDQAQPPERGRTMANRLGCRFLEVPEAGHILSLEAPESTTAILQQFLATHAA